MIDRLNARACFDELYLKASMRLRDSSAMRQHLQLGWRLSLSPAAREQAQERERQAQLAEDAQLECLSQQVLQLYKASSTDERLGEVDWTQVPTLNRLTLQRLPFVGGGD